MIEFEGRRTDATVGEAEEQDIDDDMLLSYLPHALVRGWVWKSRRTNTASVVDKL